MHPQVPDSIETLPTKLKISPPMASPPHFHLDPSFCHFLEAPRRHTCSPRATSKRDSKSWVTTASARDGARLISETLTTRVQIYNRHTVAMAALLNLQPPLGTSRRKFLTTSDGESQRVVSARWASVCQRSSGIGATWRSQFTGGFRRERRIVPQPPAHRWVRKSNFAMDERFVDVEAAAPSPALRVKRQTLILRGAPCALIHARNADSARIDGQFR